MNRTTLQKLSPTELVHQFVEMALAQDKAELYGNIAEYNRLYDKMKKVEAELKSRPGDQRRALLPYCQHRNAQVRMRAAFALLALEPTVARRTLKIISDRKEYPQAADALGMLRALDQGRYMPS